MAVEKYMKKIKMKPTAKKAPDKISQSDKHCQSSAR